MKCNAQVYIHRVIHEADKVSVTPEGHIKPRGKEEIIDVDETWLACDIHGMLATNTDYADHGISEYWEEV